MDTQERIDRALLSERELGALSFVIPDEIKSWLGDSHNFYHASKHTPGVYIGGWNQGTSPRFFDHGKRRLSRDEAIEYARLLDRLVQPRRHMPREGYPDSFEAFVAAWYEALGRALSLAFDTATARASELRTVRAAITGEV